MRTRISGESGGEGSRQTIFNGELWRVTPTPDFNNPLGVQAIARPFDRGTDLVRPGELIPARFAQDPARARQRWDELLPGGLTRIEEDRELEAAVVQGFEVIEMPILVKRPGRAVVDDYELVCEARSASVPAVGLAMGFLHPDAELVLVTHSLVRPYLHRERRWALV